MMTNRLYVDGQDAYLQWGVYVIKGGWNEAIAYPPLKSPETNDWHEENGIEVDLSNPILNVKEFSIRFAFTGDYSRLQSFIDTLADGAYHYFVSSSIQRYFKLRMTQMPNLDLVYNLGFFTIKFCDDFPLMDYEFRPPQSAITTVEDYLIDGIPFTDYGCRILKGSLNEVAKLPAVKQNLIRNISISPGAWYDDRTVIFNAKDVKLECLFRAERLSHLWRNYNALLYNLIQPDERVLYVAALDKEFKFYYKNCQVTEFYPQDKIWLRATITLVFTM